MCVDFVCVCVLILCVFSLLYYSEARARATVPGRGGEALVGFGQFKEDILKDLYDSKEKERQK